MRPEQHFVDGEIVRILLRIQVRLVRLACHHLAFRVLLVKMLGKLLLMLWKLRAVALMQQMSE